MPAATSRLPLAAMTLCISGPIGGRLVLCCSAEVII